MANPGDRVTVKEFGEYHFGTVDSVDGVDCAILFDDGTDGNYNLSEIRNHTAEGKGLLKTAVSEVIEVPVDFEQVRIDLDAAFEVRNEALAEGTVRTVRTELPSIRRSTPAGSYKVHRTQFDFYGE